MIRQAYAYLTTIPAVFIDGVIYVVLAITSAWGTILTSDAAKLYMGAKIIFWISSANIIVSSALLALKMFRSTSFADHQKDKKDPLTPTPALAVTPTQTPTVQTTKQENTDEKTSF